jgi:hypothetical protein
MHALVFSSNEWEYTDHTVTQEMLWKWTHDSHVPSSLDREE